MGVKEAKARLKINRMLEDSGWRLLADDNGPATVDVENKVNLGDDFENTKNGFVDYLLLDENQKPIAVLEAKREDIPPLSAKEQAREYANSLHVRYVILSNGNTHYLWDMQFGSPEPISSFPSLELLIQNKEWHPDVEALIGENVDNAYIATSQMPTLREHPDYINESARKTFVEKHKLKILRKYQVEAIRKVQKAAKNGKKRFLLEMATGTGKTLTCAAIIKLFLKTGNARRVLFLVDRIELENQAKKAFTQAIGSDYIVKAYKEDKDNWKTAHIVVSTVQSLLASDRYRSFSPSDFDLIISDEAHRSIGGNARAVFEYFNGYKIGLTATPKDFLKNTTQSENSEREFECRELLDTYRTFGCESGQPTFRYDLKSGVNDPDGPFLVNPIIYDARTNITSQLLDDQGYAVHRVQDDGSEIDERFGIRDFEKNFFNDETNWVLCETFMRYAAKDPISGEIGKSIIFTVGQKHAERITQILNKLAMEQFPGKYNSDFAVQITSNVMHSQDYTIQFSENKLRGQTSWLPDYDSSKARVAVTVGMMTTGYDCADLQNVVFMRPVFSPSDFIQMKGRGTRMHTFRWIDYSNEESLITIKKESFNIIDFFAVCEYFEEKYDYDAPLVVPRAKEATIGTIPLPPTNYPNPSVGIEMPYDLAESDSLKKVDETVVTKDGMRIDREMFRSFQDEVKSNDEFMSIYNRGDIEASLNYLKNHILGEDKPKFYMTPEKIRKIFGLDRRLDLREILDLIMSNKEPLTKAEYIKARFDEFVNDKQFGNELVSQSYNDAFELFDAYITDRRVADAIDDKRYGELSGFGSISMRQLKELGIDRVNQIVNYIKDYINVNKLRVKD